jgi:hypothetical protein
VSEENKKHKQLIINHLKYTCMRIFYLRSICGSWFYRISESACVSVFRATFYPSISLCPLAPSDVHNDLVECTADEYLEARNDVLQQLKIPIPKSRNQDFSIPFYPDYTGL